MEETGHLGKKRLRLSGVKCVLLAEALRGGIHGMDLICMAYFAWNRMAA
jgi:hypothetical protein